MAFEHSALANDTASLIHQAKTYRRLFADVFGSGVADVDALEVTEKSGTPNMSVDVAAGGVFIPATPSTGGTAYGYNAATINLALSASDATNDRIDLVVAYWVNGDPGVAAVKVIEGTPAPSPTEPTISDDNYLVLAAVAVDAAASSVTDSDIEDRRVTIASSATPTLVKYTSSGTFAKADYPGARAVKVRVRGGGGAGGGVNATAGGESAEGGGGGQGGFAEDIIPVASLSSSVTVTVGAGGTGSAAATGGTGGASSFGSLVAANGGAGGGAGIPVGGTASAVGGAGGAGSAGSVQLRGEYGQVGRVSSGNVHMNGNGGGGTSAPTTSTTGTDATTPGAGGSGAISGNSQPNRRGGNGGPGLVLVEVIY